MEYGALNQIEGTVTEIKKGNVMSQVTVDIGGNNQVSSVMTLESLNNLNVKEGDQVKTVVKAVNVLLVKE